MNKTARIAAAAATFAVIAAASFAAVTAAIGSSDEPAGSKPTASPIVPNAYAPADELSSTLLASGGSTAIPTSAREAIEAVTTPPAAVAEAARPGDAALEAAVLAASGLGRDHLSAVAAATSKGAVCVAFAGSTAPPSTCFPQFAPGHPVVWHAPVEAGQPLRVWGLYRPNVKSVSAIVNGERQPVELHNGFYFYEAAPNAVIGGLEYTTIDGTTGSEDIPALASIAG